MAPLRGWGPKGTRLRGFAPHGHWRTLTFIAALRCDELTAPCVFDGPINGVCFRAYVSQQLVRVLRPGRARHDQGRARPGLVPATILSRPQSHRADILKNKTLDAPGPAQNH